MLVDRSSTFTDLDQRALGSIYIAADGERYITTTPTTTHQRLSEETE
jgi:hypothetical protein